MFYALYKELVGYSLVRRLTCGVVVHTETDGVDIGIRFQHLKQHLIPDTAGGSVAVAALIFLVQRNKGQHIYGSLKEIERVVCSCPVETVTGIAALSIAFIGTFTACSSFMCVTGNVVFIVADKYGVVVIGGFIDHSLMHKGGQRICRMVSASISVGVAAVIVMSTCDYEKRTPTPLGLKFGIAVINRSIRRSCGLSENMVIVCSPCCEIKKPSGFELPQFV